MTLLAGKDSLTNIERVQELSCHVYFAEDLLQL